MSGLGRIVRSGVGRRRVQAVGVALVAAAAAAASVLGAGVLVASSEPFDSGFWTQQGAHLTVITDAARVSAQQLQATAHTDGVTAAAGPFRTAAIRFTIALPGAGARSGPPDGSRGQAPGQTAPALTVTVAGRADPGGAVDRLTLVEGSWPTTSTQIVLAAGRLRVPLGSTFTPVGVAGAPTLTVVGTARSVSATAGAWVLPQAFGPLLGSGAPSGYEMLYRFAAASTAQEVAAGGARVTAGLGEAVTAGLGEAVTAARSWLDVRREAVGRTAVLVPFLVAFAVLGLVMSVLIVGNVVAGAVGGSIRRIGVLKALGFTPLQVVRAYLGQALIPGAAGVVGGLVAGNLLALPVLAHVEDVYSTVGAHLAVWVDVAGGAAVLGLVALTAGLAALRAGRLRTVDALAVGRAGGTGRGRRAARLAARLPVSRPIGLGLARPFARPARTSGLLLAVAFGAAAVTFAVGLGSSLLRAQHAMDHDRADVVVQPGFERTVPHPAAPGSAAPGSAATPASAPPAAADVLDALRRRSGTAAVYARSSGPATVAGMPEDVEFVRFTGDPTWDDYELVGGRWYRAAAAGASGEAVASAGFLRVSGAKVGDQVSVTLDGRSARLTVVGSVFESGASLYTDAATVPDSGEAHTEYLVRLVAGTDRDAYLAALTPTVQTWGLSAESTHVTLDDFLVVVDALATTLTLLLLAVATIGVLNVVLLDLRDRVHELGVHRALGMQPRQIVTMVLSSVLGVGLVGGLVGVAAGRVLHHEVVTAMGATIGSAIPAAVLDVYRAGVLVPLSAGGLVIAMAGALLPATWAARTRTATALRTE